MFVHSAVCFFLGASNIHVWNDSPINFFAKRSCNLTNGFVTRIMEEARFSTDHFKQRTTNHVAPSKRCYNH